MSRTLDSSFPQCPFIKALNVKKRFVKCEAGTITAPDDYTFRELINLYCGARWRNCTMAGALGRYYERKD